MLRIILDDRDLDLPENIQVEMTMTNPMFTESGFDESFSYSFAVPKTPKNQATVRRMTSKEGEMKLLFYNLLLEEGVCIVKTTVNNYSITFKNNGVELRQKLEKVSLKSLDLESIEVCELGDTAPTKIDKWNDHMTQTTLVDAPNEGSHKFPYIKAFDDTQGGQYFTDWFLKNRAWDFDVNSYWNGEYLKNPGKSTADEPAWWTTVSPCIRIQYLFNQLLAFMAIDVVEDELKDVVEFQQMIHYSLLAMDKVEAYSGQNFNVHGTTINLTKFVPGINGIDLFKMLDEIFGLHVIFRNGKMIIRLKKNSINKSFVDYSKYCNPLYEIDDVDGKRLNLKYPIDLTNVDRFQNPIWTTKISDAPGSDLVIEKHNSRDFGTEDDSEEIELSYIPMKSQINYIDRIYPGSFAGTITEEEGMVIWFNIPLEQTSSYYDEQSYNNGGGSEKFIIGLIRGMYPFKNYTHGVYNDRLITENSKKLDPVHHYEDHAYSFGTCSLYIKDANSHVDVYLKEYFNHLRKGKTIKKTLYLALHKIIELRKWKDVNHIIKQRNLSFKGVVKEINFTLYKNAISPCNVTYSVLNDEPAGDFNNDFNDDFLS